MPSKTAEVLAALTGEHATSTTVYQGMSFNWAKQIAAKLNAEWEQEHGADS